MTRIYSLLEQIYEKNATPEAKALNPTLGIGMKSFA
jgi:hypothetical protein